MAIMETIELKARQATENFWVIVREDVNNPGPMCDGMKLDGAHESHHYMYSTKDEAVARCEKYARGRKGGGENYRYYVMQTVACIQYKQENKDGN